LHQGTFSAIPPTSAASPFDRQALSSNKKRVAATRWHSTTALPARKAADLKTTKTTRTFADRHHLVDLSSRL
jgi:hypothetical protein